MINPKIIRSFLERKLNSYDWVKDYPRSAINAELSAMAPSPDFSAINLWKHQAACFLILMALKRFILHISPGGGKTLLTLSIIKYRKQCGEKPKAIVFVPYITSVEVWAEEVAKHAPELKCISLTGTSKQNLASLDSKGDLFVICYQSAVAMVTKKVPSKKSGKNKWKLEAGRVRDYFKSFDMLVCDEIHKTKSSSTLAYRMCRAVASQADWVFGLTGTPFGKDLADLWSQFYLIDFGETLGPTLGLFREAFFSQKPGQWGGVEYKFKKSLLPKLKQMIKNTSIHYSADEFADMPPKFPIKHILRPPESSIGYVDMAKEALAKAIRENDYKATQSEYLRLRQLSSGFMTLHGDDNKVEIAFEDNPKLDDLTELIESIPPECKIVIFHFFVYSNHLISERLKKIGVKHARIWGQQKDQIGELRRFKQDPQCQAMVINLKSGSSALNLQGANYLSFFEQPDTSIDRIQAEARVWRPGQERRVFIHDPLVRGTADIKMYKANKSGQNLLELLLSGKVKV